MVEKLVIPTAVFIGPEGVRDGLYVREALGELKSLSLRMGLTYFDIS